MATKIGISSPISIIELPKKVDGLSAQFRYYSYEPEEKVSIARLDSKLLRYDTTGDDEKNAFVSPRYVDITINQTENLSGDDKITKIVNKTEAMHVAYQAGAVGAMVSDPNNSSVYTVTEMTRAEMEGEVIEEIFSVEAFQHTSTPGLGSLYFTQDFCQGFVRKTDGDLQNKINLKRTISSTLEEKTVLNYIKNTLSGSIFQEGDIDVYEETLLKGANETAMDDLILLDENTLLPSTEAMIPEEKASSDSYINSAYVHQIFSRTQMSPVGEELSNRTMKITELIEKKATPLKEERYLSSFKKQIFDNVIFGEGIPMQACYFECTELDWSMNRLSNPADEHTWIHLGYQVQKYILDGENRLYRGSFLVPKSEGSMTQIRDPHILYGKEYFYEIRDAWAYVRPVGHTSYAIEQDVSQILDQFQLGGEQKILFDMVEKEPPDKWKDYLNDEIGVDGTSVTDMLFEYLHQFESMDKDDAAAALFGERFIPVHSMGFILLGTETVGISVIAREKAPPIPPSSFSFDYRGNNEIKLSWTKSLKSWENVNTMDQNNSLVNIVADDVGGFLLFIRHDLLEPYELYRQFHFITKQKQSNVLSGYYENGRATWVSEAETQEDYNTSIPANIIACNIGPNNIEYLRDASNFSHVLSLRSNVDYYIGMIAYDVHGNMSVLSEQFYVRRNNVTGEVLTKNVCGAGAPISYPNMIIPSKFVLSSMKASGYRYMDVYQTPSTYASFPSEGKLTIQLIDLETESDVTIQGLGPDDFEG